MEKQVGFPKRNLLSEPDGKEEVELLKEFVSEYSGGVLHPNHYIIQEVNLRIVTGETHSLSELSDQDLSDYLARCASLLSISNIITPGFGEWRGEND